MLIHSKWKERTENKARWQNANSYSRWSPCTSSEGGAWCPQRPRWSHGNMCTGFWFLKMKHAMFFKRNLPPFRRGNLVNFIPTSIAEDTVCWTVPQDICLSKYSSVLCCIFRHCCETTCSCQRGRHGIPYLVTAPLPSHMNAKPPHIHLNLDPSPRTI